MQLHWASHSVVLDPHDALMLHESALGHVAGGLLKRPCLALSQQNARQPLKMKQQKGCDHCHDWKVAEQLLLQLSQQLLDLPWRKQHHLSELLSAAAEHLFGFHSWSGNPQGSDPPLSCCGQ